MNWPSTLSPEKFLALATMSSAKRRIPCMNSGRGIPATFHLLELELPFARHLRRRQRLNADSAEEVDQRKSLLRDDEVTALAVEVTIEEQSFDDLRAGGGSAETALAHRLAEFLVFDEFARALHRGEQRAFREAGGRFGLVLGDFDVPGFGGFALHHRAKSLLVLAGGLFAVDGQPAGIDDDLAFALESLAFDACDARCDFELRGRIEDGDEAPGHHVKDLHLDLIEILCRDARGDDGVVIGHLCIVENTLVGSYPSLRKRLSVRARSGRDFQTW